MMKEGLFGLSSRPLVTTMERKLGLRQGMGCADFPLGNCSGREAPESRACYSLRALPGLAVGSLLSPGGQNRVPESPHGNA